MRPFVTIVTRRGILQETVRNLEKTEYLKKLVLVLTTSASMTDTRREATYERVLYIQYLIQFCQKNNEHKDKDIRALIHSSSKVNVILTVYAIKLDLYTRKIDVGVQKIDKSDLDTFGIVIADYSVRDKLERVRFF